MISLAVAAVPEGLPTLATTTLAMAIQDLRRRGIIMRRLSAVEGLAGVDIACFDKTGTLTLNDMSVVRLYWNETRARLDRRAVPQPTGSLRGLHDRSRAGPPVRARRSFAMMPSYSMQLAAGANGSATELALVRARDSRGPRRRGHPASPSAPSDPRTRRRPPFMLTVHDAAADQKLVIVKGDPGEVLVLCRWHTPQRHPEHPRIRGSADNRKQRT